MNRHYSVDSLKEMAGDDRDFMAIVAKTFLDEIPPDLTAMDLMRIPALHGTSHAILAAASLYESMRVLEELKEDFNL